MTHHSRFVELAAVVVIAAAVLPLLASISVKVESDKDFDFTRVRTWGWSAAGPGDVIMGRTPDDNPEAMKRLAEPIIMDAVTTGMQRRGLRQVEATPDVTVSYYLLLSTSQSAQTMGQFLPTAEWGLPPFNGATQSLKVMNQGSLVLDLSAGGVVVWRGVAQTKIGWDADDRKREALLREGVSALLRRYPPKR